MNILENKSAAKLVSLDKLNFCVDFIDGRKLFVPIAYFPRLLKAANEQRQKVIISGGGGGLYWDELDEDISVRNLLLGFGDTTKPQVQDFQAA
ncbi:MAG: DUF2442 domain-containing protein [Ignavibacteria bacterium]|nr:DUF2442 domain-containing protein [Ignavibacteria bacterium]